MPHSSEGPSVVPGRRAIRVVGLVGLALSLAVGVMAVGPQPAEAAAKKVVIVVGPVGSNTSYFKSVANEVAVQAAKYGAKVIKIYTPNATWGRVKNAAQGANVFVYLGHGNGWPSPYKPFQRYTKNGLGLNPQLSGGNTKVKYWGEKYVASELKLARNSVVLLMRLCYASGNSEPGKADPTKSVAMQRVDNYGAGFLRTNARIVFAQGYGKSNHIFYSLYKTNRTMKEIFWADPSRTNKYTLTFSSSRTSGMKGILDPYRSSKFYRSVVGELGFKASAWR